jgi:DNA-binding CsgD family transcriptional regulator
VILIDYLAEGEPLRDRERVILELAAEGLSNRQIAERLRLSHKTVESYLYSAYAKLGVRSRVPAVVEAVRRGWVGSGDDEATYASGYREGFQAALSQVTAYVAALSGGSP